MAIWAVRVMGVSSWSTVGYCIVLNIYYKHAFVYWMMKKIKREIGTCGFTGLGRSPARK